MCALPSVLAHILTVRGPRHAHPRSRRPRDPLVNRLTTVEVCRGEERELRVKVLKGRGTKGLVDRRLVGVGVGPDREGVPTYGFRVEGTGRSGTHVHPPGPSGLPVLGYRPRGGRPPVPLYLPPPDPTSDSVRPPSRTRALRS